MSKYKFLDYREKHVRTAKGPATSAAENLGIVQTSKSCGMSPDFKSIGTAVRECQIVSDDGICFHGLHLVKALQ